MCGIAGYHISKAWADKYLTEKKMQNILQEAWFHNIHRGYEAAGFFSVSNNDHFLLFKNPGTAAETFDKEIKDKGILEVARIFAAHTRSPSGVSSGSASDNENNHPVVWDKVWTIHNGTIYNDSLVKDIYAKGKDRENVPEVDSLALSMILSDLKPTNFKEILSSLDDLSGTFSTHSVWTDHPKYSLVTRSSLHIPLVTAFHASNEAFFYGSEPESVWHTIRMMGLTPNAKGWNWRTLDPGHAILLEEGCPIEWGSFNFHSRATIFGQKTKHKMQRWLPREKTSKRKRVKVYETDSPSDYINKAKLFSFKDQQKGKEIYTRKNGFTKKEDLSFPLSKGELNWGAVLSEADSVYRDGELLHAFYGDTEIVVTSGGRILRDVFNHAQYNNRQRWTKVADHNPATITSVPNKLEWKEFVKLKTTGIASSEIPNTIGDYQYVKDLLIAKDKSREILEIKEDEIMNLMEPNIKVGWNNLELVMTHHDDPTLIFLAIDAVCHVHKVQFKDHKKPLDCTTLLYASSFAYAAILEGIDVFVAFDGLEVSYNYSLAVCSGGTKQCYFNTSEIVKVYSGTFYWEIIVEEECYFCETTRRLEALPEWFEKLQYSERLKVTTYAY